MSEFNVRITVRLLKKQRMFESNEPKLKAISLTVTDCKRATVDSGSIETPIWAICEIGCAPNILVLFVDSSFNFFSCEILNIAEGLLLEM